MTSTPSTNKERVIWRYPALRKRNLREMYDLAILCNKCKYCRFVFTPDARDHRFVNQCPRGETFGFASYYAEGTVEIARGIIEGRLGWSKTIEHILYTCTDCAHCEFWCENAMRVYPLTIMEIMKEHYVKEVGLPEYWKPIVENLKKFRNPFGEPVEKRGSWVPPGVSLPRSASVMLFVGDAYSYRVQHVAQAALRILSRLGVEAGYLYEEEWHSGYLLFRAGLYEDGLEFLEHNIKALEKAGAKTVVFLDAHDYRTFVKETKDAGIELPFEVKFFTDFVLPLLQKDSSRLRKLGIKAVYHDPCNLTRHVMPFPVWDSPREILKLIGVEVVEMFRNRLNTYCCGAGGGVMFTFPELNAVTAKRRVEEAAAVGGQYIVTACPYCVQSFKSVAKESGMGVYDVIELLDKALI
uniref:(Fe-S)-binding protein n=1 Tax=Ignisphaera aggregans TaxID=334771 RepID=A0A7C2ZPM1_9CREN